MIDIDKEQRLASNPLSSVWVAASAGSGKTKVLTDRVINLLLLNGQPEKLLCLTYTKAASAEMANRINKILKEWVVCPDNDLAEQIQKLTGETPTQEQLLRARRLFTAVLETPGGLKIMTIHSFCQSVLKRFPLEANVPPNFEIIDETKAQTMLHTILENVLADPDFQDDIALLSQYMTQDDLIGLLQALFDDRAKLIKLREKSSLKTIVTQMKQYFDIAKYDTEFDLISDYISPEEWPLISEKFLTDKGVAHAKKAHIEMAQIAEKIEQGLRNLKLIRLTEALLRLAYTILTRYQNQKKVAGFLEHEDTIIATKALLERSHAAAWVLFKLDGGIDHILVDEAQDTNPNQWAIIRMIAEEFFSGEDHHDTLRTLFVVGDRKQSIYSFQGAVPDEFERMRHFFETKIRASENDFQSVSFNLSFRSTQPILDVVNSVLQHPIARCGILEKDEIAPHTPYRNQESGLVEIWPVIPKEKNDKPQPWRPPVEGVRGKSALSRLCEKIVNKIDSMLKNKEILESQARPVQPGDFLILVQQRNDLMTELVRGLKEKGIPVSGIDRLNLSNHIAVQDLISAAKFALLPEDNLNLACLLKSPIFNMTDDDLFRASYGRKNESLWDRIQIIFPHQAEQLKSILNKADKIPPYEFFGHILGPMGGRKAFLSRLGQEANEAIDEFLNLVLTFEQSDIPSLQHFIDNILARKKIEIKRDMESAQNAVRIMTVHASKGLQGNIVFLPQTRYILQRRPKFVWINDEIPLWIPNKIMTSVMAEKLVQRDLDKNTNENRRLLYVALTRPKDRLYICGYDGKKPKEDNWYDLIVNSLKAYPPPSLSVCKPDGNGIIRIVSDQKKIVQPKIEKSKYISPELPNWALYPPQPEPSLSKPLSPSKPDHEEPVTGSPISEGQALAMERGTFIHRLLQCLPDIPQQNRTVAINRLKPPHIDVPPYLNDLLNSKEFSEIFGPNSRAEVPVVGILKDKAVSGQIDRLIVTDKEVWIVDFKTNRNVPDTESNVPLLYREQLSAYRGLISQIFSNKIIRTFLLWTETLQLMEIKNDN